MTEAADGWGELVSAALVGTGRRPVPEVSVPGVGATTSAGDDLPADDAGRLLDAAALLTAARRAGWRPGRDEPLAPARADAWPEVNAAAAGRLSRILGGEQAALLAEWLTVAAARHRRVPGPLLPALLEQARKSRSLAGPAAAAGGRRAQWLAGLNPAWAYLLAAPAPADTDLPTGGDPAQAPAWRLGRSAERRGYLAALRARDPGPARELVAAGWAQAGPDERAWFVTTLADGLSRADEPVLENALDDRRAEVRQAAADLLAALDGSALGQRMAARAVAWVRAERAGLRGRRLVAEPPAECDAGMRRDGIAPQRPARHPGRGGPRAWWLEEVAARTPLATWPQALRAAPADLVRMRRDEWGPQLLAGWARAAATQRDVTWARVLLERAADGERDGLMAHLGGLLLVLPPAARMPVAAALVDGVNDPHALAGLLDELPGPWAGELATAVLTALPRLAGRAGALAAVAARAGLRLDPALAGPGGPAWLAKRGELPPEAPAPVHDLAATLRFRFEMLKELDDDDQPG